MHSNVAIIVIGRNEGERLKVCLKSALQLKPLIVVYVDSGSTDASVDFAQSVGCAVVLLDLWTPFTAGTARNVGYRYALAQHPDLRYIQFVDGDCELVQSWLGAAQAFLDQHPDYAVACGRRRERYPSKSLYNKLIDIEWNTPIGEAKSCGGDALMRAHALTAVNGFRTDLIAGEEPELCIRLRQNGHKIMRLDQEMTLHDAAISRFSQWWIRAKRAGYAFAAGAALHGAGVERHWVKETRSAWVWGLLLPLTATTAAAFLDVNFFYLFLLYPIQVARIALNQRPLKAIAWLYAFSLVVAKFPEMSGQCKYWWQKRRYATPKLIEYK